MNPRPKTTFVGVARFLATLSLALATTLLAAVPQNAAAQARQKPWRTMSQAELSAVWWRWAFSVPKATSPFFDDTGANANAGQPYPDLLFLAGTFTVTQLQNGDLLSEVNRSTSVKAGTALFFPLINSEWDNVCALPRWGGNCFNVTGYPYAAGVPELQRLAAAGPNRATGLYARLTPTDSSFAVATGPQVPIAYTRLQSPPFSYVLPRGENLYTALVGINISGTVAPAVADGNFGFVPGVLAPGHYWLEFGGSQPIDDAGHMFTLVVTYKLTVDP